MPPYPVPPPPAFAARLRTLRERAKLTPTELAHAAGLTQQALSLLERGERNPTWATVQALADALGVRTDTLRATP